MNQAERPASIGGQVRPISWPEWLGRLRAGCASPQAAPAHPQLQPCLNFHKLPQAHHTMTSRIAHSCSWPHLTCTSLVLIASAWPGPRAVAGFGAGARAPLTQPQLCLHLRLLQQGCKRLPRLGLLSACQLAEICHICISLLGAPQGAQNCLSLLQPPMSRQPPVGRQARHKSVESMH